MNAQFVASFFIMLRKRHITKKECFVRYFSADFDNHFLSQKNIYVGIRELNTICPVLVKFPLFRLVVFARRQPCFILAHQKIKNFPSHRVGELRQCKFFVGQGKSAGNPFRINEHFDTVRREICLP